jgi:hypothetical protein
VPQQYVTWWSTTSSKTKRAPTCPVATVGDHKVLSNDGARTRCSVHAKNDKMKETRSDKIICAVLTGKTTRGTCRRVEV